ncbi:hypothetical protein AA700_0707 [Acidiphilium acidophilum DSM 700]|uniref:Uncharacterized protein n=1 Tax=Acidiphilium acidophilum TaxID=76588 RepID=A0AAW9DKK3_ACIAO|nr:hypothetical protein [Acidiphilium acidophilum]GBR77120.1 hypothetical protein AA700_0707 [Acidiphilium acidophilum DSM 700]
MKKLYFNILDAFRTAERGSAYAAALLGFALHYTRTSGRRFEGLWR